jgi:hypothetical protein
MNMEVKSVRKSPPGLARKRLGTKAHFPINASPPLISTKKNKTFRAIKAYVTNGTVLLAVSSSPIGNIRLIFTLDLSQLHVKMSLEVFKERDLLTINIYLQLEEKRATGDFRWPREWRKPERDNDLMKGTQSRLTAALHKKCFTVSEPEAVATGPILNFWSAT